MEPRLHEIEEQALRLPPTDRELLVERLLESLRQETEMKIEPAWLAEATKRYRDYKEGRVEGIPSEGFFAGIRQELGWRS